MATFEFVIQKQSQVQFYTPLKKTRTQNIPMLNRNQRCKSLYPTNDLLMEKYITLSETNYKKKMGKTARDKNKGVLIIVQNGYRPNNID